MIFAFFYIFGKIIIFYLNPKNGYSAIAGVQGVIANLPRYTIKSFSNIACYIFN